MVEEEHQEAACPARAREEAGLTKGSPPRHLAAAVRRVGTGWSLNHLEARNGRGNVVGIAGIILAIDGETIGEVTSAIDMMGIGEDRGRGRGVQANGIDRGTTGIGIGTRTWIGIGIAGGIGGAGVIGHGIEIEIVEIGDSISGKV